MQLLDPDLDKSLDFCMEAFGSKALCGIRPIGKSMPEMIDAATEDINLPGCSAMESLNRRESFVNSLLANAALHF